MYVCYTMSDIAMQRTVCVVLIMKYAAGDSIVPF